MTYGNGSLCEGVAKQRFASAAKVTLSNNKDDAEENDDRLMQLAVVLSITTVAAAAAAAAARHTNISIDWFITPHSCQLHSSLRQAK